MMTADTSATATADRYEVHHRPTIARNFLTDGYDYAVIDTHTVQAVEYFKSKLAAQFDCDRRNAVFRRNQDACQKRKHGNKAGTSEE